MQRSVTDVTDLTTVPMQPQQMTSMGSSDTTAVYYTQLLLERETAHHDRTIRQLASMQSRVSELEAQIHSKPTIPAPTPTISAERVAKVMVRLEVSVYLVHPLP